MTTTAQPPPTDGLSEPLERIWQMEYVKGWNLSFDAHPRDPNCAWKVADVTLTYWRTVEGIHIHQRLDLTVEAALKLREMLNDMVTAIAQQHAPAVAPEHSPFSHGDDYGGFLTCTECAPDREPVEAQP